MVAPVVTGVAAAGRAVGTASARAARATSKGVGKQVAGTSTSTASLSGVQPFTGTNVATGKSARPPARGSRVVPPRQPSTPSGGAQSRRSMRRMARGRTQAQGTYVEESEVAGGARDYRIPTQTKWTMVCIALMLDLLPVITLFALLIIGFSMFGGNNAAIWCMEYVTEKNLIAKGAAGVKCLTAGGAAAAASGLSGLILGPAVYALVSVLAYTFAILLFFTWFMLRGVPFISFSGNRLFLFSATTLLEILPFTSWLPGITVLVWKQVALSRREDEGRA